MTWETDVPATQAKESGWDNDVPATQAPLPNRPAQLASGVNQGFGQVADFVLNAPQHVANLGAEWYNSQEKPSSWPQAPQFAPPNYGQRAAAALGATPAPLDDYIGGLLQRLGQFIGASAMPIGKLGSVGQLAKQVGGGAVAGASSIAAGEVAKAATDNPAVQSVAELAGALAPTGASLAVTAAKKAALRGGATAEDIAANTQQMRAAGIEPTVGQVTGNIAAQGAENILARTPFAGLPVMRRAQEQVDTIGQSIADMSRGLSTVREKPAVGALIQKDLNGFVESTQGKFLALDNEFKAMFPPEQKFAVGNTSSVLGKLSKVAPDLPSFSAGLKDPNIRNWAERIAADTAGTPATTTASAILGPGGKPAFTTTTPAKPFQGASMQTLIDVRSDIGTNINKSTLLGQKPDAQYSALYSAISKDIEAAAKGTSAEAVLARRDNYWRAFRGRVDNFLDYIAENPNKTQAYLDTLSGANVGREQILAVRRSVEPTTWKAVASAKLAQMGQDTKLGEFSLQKFVTEYKKMSDVPVGSKALSPADALFGGMGTLKTNLDTIVAASEKILAGGRVYQNPSGTSTAAIGIGGSLFLMGSAFTRLLQGDLMGPAATVAGVAGALGTARHLSNVLTNPKTVDWLAQSTRIPAEKAPEYLKRLTPIIANISDPQERKAVQSWRDDVQQRLTK